MKLLLLAGSSEARSLAEQLAKMPGIQVVASLAGVTREPQDLPVPMRIGRFGGRDEYRQYLQDEGFDAVVDATHPFAANISRRCAQVAREMNMAHLQIMRPAWQAGDGDNWTFVDDESHAVDHIPKGATVLLATGRQTLQRFENMAGRYLICRQIDQSTGDFPFECGEFLIGKPPFSVDDEIALLKERNIDWVVVKNAGGMLSQSKLVAARQMGLPVLLINRPAALDCNKVETANQALEWVLGQL